MHYVPWSEAEATEFKKKIDAVEKDISSRQRYLTNLKERLGMGKPTLDVDFSGMPWPEPNCYYCVNTPGSSICLKHHKYGSVCEEYKHWKDKVQV
jgi:hypothetical protein